MPTLSPSQSTRKPIVSVAHRVRRGDLWQLGDHRLLCGDATDALSLERLIASGDQAPVLTITSPPYNLGPQAEHVRRNVRSGENGKYLPRLADKLPRQEYLDLLTSSAKNALTVSEYAFIIIAPLAATKIALLEWLYEMREHLADIAIWHKGFGQPAIGRNTLNSSFELILILSRKSMPSRSISTANFRGTISNVYRANGQRANNYFRQHRATFPLHLPTWIMQTFDANSTGAVFDHFSGTGTTLIAAERLGRACYAMELEPTYCDIILDRWEKETAEQPKLVSRHR